LAEKLKAIHGDKVLQYSSSSSKAMKKRIQDNFDPGQKKQLDDIKILITTDVLAEGVNLHRSNVVINYDLPWNPTRVMQRLGRINRIGSPFDKIYVYNFFPSSQGESAINLEANIVSKIQAFHETLGDDIKYLSDNEEITSFGLYQALNDTAILEGSEEEIRSPLHYLSIIRKIRDEDPDLFEKIKKLPKKSRTGRESTLLNGTQTLSFFKKGLLRKFYISDASETEEISFFQAADLFEADPQVISQKINREFYDQLNKNKKIFFQGMMQEEEEKPELSGKSASLVKYLKALYSEKCFSDFEVDYLRSIETALREGTIAKNLVNQLLKKIINKKPVDILNILRDDLPDVYLQTEPDDKKDDMRAEIILSEYIIGG
jgi:superfamily II DNA/RNA helicase